MVLKKCENYVKITNATVNTLQNQEEKHMELLVTEYEFRITTSGKTWDLEIILSNSKNIIDVKKYSGLEGGDDI